MYENDFIEWVFKGCNSFLIDIDQRLVYCHNSDLALKVILIIIFVILLMIFLLINYIHKKFYKY